MERFKKNHMNHVTTVDTFMPREPALLPDHPIWALRYMEELEFQKELAEINKGIPF